MAVPKPPFGSTNLAREKQEKNKVELVGVGRHASQIERGVPAKKRGKTPIQEILLVQSMVDLR